jgi:hypothetical protein
VNAGDPRDNATGGREDVEERDVRELERPSCNIDVAAGSVAPTNR